MEALFSDNRLTYNGELSSHWNYKNFGIVGDGIAAFIGEVNVARDKIIDLTEALDQSYIYSPLMLNFVVEHFNHDLNLAIYRQRLFMVCIKEELEQHSLSISRRGDNLYVHKAKLTVSIATATTVSTLMHIGINLETAGAPVEACGLFELGIKDVRAVAENIMLRYRREIDQIYEARCKVRPV